ncbi:MAG: hypothetical protein NPIRA04_35140 [Nitrospirales bacterium]|nr:MAG: hypothetical protein NPIRA04_35140 [Nitrospirales bacterium]
MKHHTLFAILLILSLGALALPAMADSGSFCETIKPDGTDTCPDEPNPGPDPIQCPDGTTVNNLEDCPPVHCPDGTEVPNGQICPPVQCPDGSEVPNGQTCPPVHCPDGTEVPNGQACPPVQCPDGTEVPNGQACPPVLCPDGSKLPNGQQCPKPDLSGKLTVTRMSNQVARVNIKVINTGAAPALSATDGGYVIDVGLFRSTASKTPIAGTTIRRIKSTKTLNPGASETFQVDIPLLSNFSLPKDEINVCADIDPEEVVNESNEDNNRPCQAI